MNLMTVHKWKSKMLQHKTNLTVGNGFAAFQARLYIKSTGSL